jgi:hypothetical protein
MSMVERQLNLTLEPREKSLGPDTGTAAGQIGEQPGYSRYCASASNFPPNFPPRFPPNEFHRIERKMIQLLV